MSFSCIHILSAMVPQDMCRPRVSYKRMRPCASIIACLGEPLKHLLIGSSELMVDSAKKKIPRRVQTTAIYGQYVIIFGVRP